MALAMSRGAAVGVVIFMCVLHVFLIGAQHAGRGPLPSMRKTSCVGPDIAGLDAPQRPNVDRSQALLLSLGMEQTQPGGQLRSAGGGTMSKAADAKDRVDHALSRLESMVDERLAAEQMRAEELSKRLARLEREHDELRKVASEVEGRLERAMEYIRSLLAADQK